MTIALRCEWASGFYLLEIVVELHDALLRTNAADNREDEVVEDLLHAVFAEEFGPHHKVSDCISGHGDKLKINVINKVALASSLVKELLYFAAGLLLMVVDPFHGFRIAVDVDEELRPNIVELDNLKAVKLKNNRNGGGVLLQGKLLHVFAKAL